MTGPAACPSCGDSDRLYALVHYVGYRRGTAHLENGVAQFDWVGPVEVEKSEGGVPIGVACDCSWRGTLSDLVLARG